MRFRFPAGIILILATMCLMAPAAFAHGGEDLLLKANGKEVFIKKTKPGMLVLGHNVVNKTTKKAKSARKLSATATSTVGMSLVRDVAGYEALVVSRDVVYAVLMRDRSWLYKSTDKGVSWQPLHKFSSRVWTVTEADPGLLFASENGGAAGGQIIWRSADGGNTWTTTSFQDPTTNTKFNNSLSAIGASGYQLLTGRNIAQFTDGTLVLGTYISGNRDTYPNVIYRSTDSGNTWLIAYSDLANPEHRHIHGLRIDPATGILYVFYGDSPGRDGVWQSSDKGSTITPSCSNQIDNRCIVIDAALNGNTAVWGSDNAFGANSISRFNMDTRSIQQLTVGMSYPSYSAHQTACGPALVATLYEGAGSWVNNDRYRRVYAVTSDNTVTNVMSYAIATNPSNPAVPASYPQGIYIVGEYSDGTIVFKVTSRGTVFARMTGVVCGSSTPPPTSTAPINTTAPAITGTTTVGQVLTGNDGVWSGNPTPSTSRQWLRCDTNGANCTAISGATGTSYTLVTGDAGSTMKMSVTASNSVAAVTVNSTATAVVAAATSGGESTPPPVTPPSSNNLAPNPGFELDPSGSYSSNGTGTFSWATDALHGGSHSLKMIASTGNLTRWLSTNTAIPATAGKVYSANVFVMTTSGKASIALVYLTSSGGYAGTTCESPGAAGSWVSVSVTCTAPTGTAYVRVEFRNGWSPGTSWFDDPVVISN